MLVIMKYVYITIYLYQSVVFGVTAPKIPISPCPDIFLYKFDNNIYYADMNIGPIDYNWGYSSLRANFEIEAYMPQNSNFGEIIFDETNESALDKIKKGLSLNFKVIFPFRNILPYLTSIILNEITICLNAPDILQDFSYKTSYYLQYNITWNANNNNPNIRQNTVQYTTPVSNPEPSNIEDRGQRDSVPIKFNSEYSDTECGIASNQNLQPWLVGLFQQNYRQFNFFCSGVLISNKHIMTAAHCTSGQTKIYVKLGSKDVTQYMDRNTVSRYSQQIFPHPDYDEEYFDSDLAIILLNEEVPITSNIRTICFWPQNINVPLTNIQIIGWENIQKHYSVGNFIEKSVVENNLEECIQSNTKIYSDNLLCISGNPQFCYNNFDGVLTIYENNRYILRAIKTINDANSNVCNKNNIYSTFTDITKYIDWIKFTLRSI